MSAVMPREETMRRFLAVLISAALLSGMLVGSVAGASRPDPVVTFDAARATVWSGALLRGGSGVAAADLVRTFLRSKGKSDATVASLKVDNQFTSRGITFVRLRQDVGGLRVHGAYVRAAVNAKGQLVHVISNVVDLRGSAADTAVTAAQALDASLTRNHPNLKERPAIDSAAGKTTYFKKSSAFAARPSAERILVARRSGALERGWLVTTWTARGNELRQSIVSRGGAVAYVVDMTANDTYDVFVEDPAKDVQTTEPGAGNGTPESPAGWLTGGQKTTNITGNNTHTYLDRDANNQADAGGSAVNDGVFDAVADIGGDPLSAANQAVAVQNLFWHVNLVHDLLYANGFTEATGNFQESNFGLGGKDSDSVNAEAQDGGGFDNANFATPPDGSNPRMQMFLFTGIGGTDEVVVGSQIFDAVVAQFSAPLDTTGVTGGIQLVNDGVAGGTVTDACEALPRGSLDGAIALIDRGLCNFDLKAKHAQTAGAVGVIVANNAAGAPFVMGGSGGFKIPSVMVSQADGATLRAFAAGTSTIVRHKAVQPVPLDGDLDSDVIFHEYGHGLTWRMIGHMSGTLAGAIGEGASDTLAFLINEDDLIGEYVSPGGIRRNPYHDYPRTYSQWTADEVHNDGEIYAAAMWRVYELYLAAGLTNDDVLATFVDGMNFTPAAPAPEDMRDGMLASAALHAPNETCLIWQGFAEQGIGVGAHGKQGDSFKITESFAVPAACD
jgi:extracellular elastinolytic metalloproteinase